MASLFYLYWRIIINDYKERFFSKSTLAGVIILIILSVFFIAFGYFLGYAVIYSYYQTKVKLGINTNIVNQMLVIMTAIFVITNTLSPLNLIKQLNYNVLCIFPLSKSTIFTFDIVSSITDVRLLLLFELIISLIAGAGGFSYSIIYALLLLLMSITTMYFIHLLTELIKSIIKLLSSLLRLKISILLIASFFLAYFFFIKNLSWKFLLKDNPINWSINSIFSYTLFNDRQWIYKNIFINIIYSLALFVTVLAVRLLHDKLGSKKVVHKQSVNKERIIKLPHIISLFPENIKLYLEKDTKYIGRSNRSLIAVLLEITILCILCYLHFTHSKICDHTYVVLGFVIIGPVMIWDFYLSNYWGFEKRGFGFYLFSNADLRYAILSKNISFILTRSFTIIFMSMVISLIYSFKIFMPMIILGIILSIVMLIFSNIVAIKNPYSVDLKENVFSQTQKVKFSLIGFIGLITYLIIPSILLFIFYKVGAGEILYFVSLSILAFCMAAYLILLSYSTKLLNEKKIIIYKKLIKI